MLVNVGRHASLEMLVTAFGDRKGAVSHVYTRTKYLGMSEQVGEMLGRTQTRKYKREKVMVLPSLGYQSG